MAVYNGRARIVASDPLTDPENNMAQATTMPPSSSSAAARATLDAGPILLRWHGDVAVVTLNRPDKLNSFTRQMHEALVAALDHVEAGRARALLLTGAGRGFCAGQDLADLDFTPGHSTDLGELIDTWFNPLVRRL